MTLKIMPHEEWESLQYGLSRLKALESDLGYAKDEIASLRKNIESHEEKLLSIRVQVHTCTGRMDDNAVGAVGSLIKSHDTLKGQLSYARAECKTLEERLDQAEDLNDRLKAECKMLQDKWRDITANARRDVERMFAERDKEDNRKHAALLSTFKSEYLAPLQEKNDQRDAKIMASISEVTGAGYISLIDAVSHIVELYKTSASDLKAIYSQENERDRNLLLRIEGATNKRYTSLENGIRDIATLYVVTREAEKAEGEIIKKISRATGGQGTLSELVDRLLEDRNRENNNWGRAYLSQQVRHKIGDELGIHFDDCMKAVGALVESRRVFKDKVELHNKVESISRQMILKELGPKGLEIASLSLLIEDLIKSHRAYREEMEGVQCVGGLAQYKKEIEKEVACAQPSLGYAIKAIIMSHAQWRRIAEDQRTLRLAVDAVLKRVKEAVNG